MGNKQKLQKNVSKKPQGEKTQRSVHIVKHFQPNVAYSKLHRNCDLPEVNADVDSKETLSNIKKSIVSQPFSRENRKVRISSIKKPVDSKETLNNIKKSIVSQPLLRENKNVRITISSKNEKKSSKALDSYSTPLLHKLNTANKLKSITKLSLTSGSSTTKESLPLKLNKISAVGVKRNDKQNNLKKPFLKSSLTTSSTSSKENDSTKAKTFQTNKSKSFSVNVTKTDKIDPKSIKFCSLGDKSKKVEDLKKEIRANQLQKLGSYVNNNINSNSHRERVQTLRDEIKKLINTNIEDKRKHLTELTTEIAEFRTNNNVLIYNVDTQINKKDEPVENSQEISWSNENETVDVPRDVPKDLAENEPCMKNSRKFCGLPVGEPEMEDQEIPVDHVEHVLSELNMQHEIFSKTVVIHKSI